MDLPGRTPRGRVGFPPPRWRLLWHATGTGLVAALGGLAVQGGSEFWRAVGWVLLALLVPATLVLLARAVRPGPSVVVDGAGITDRTAFAPTGLVRWDEIAGIRKREIGRGIGRERLLEVVLLDPDRFRARPRSRLRRLADRYRGLIRQPDVTIAGSMVSRPLAAVIDAVHRHRPELEVMELPPRQPGLWERIGRSRPRPRKPHPEVPRW